MQTIKRSCTQYTNRNLSQMLVLVVSALLVTGCALVSASTQTYSVQPGDTLAQIAAAHDKTVDELVGLNQQTYPSLVSDPGAIKVGWKLVVPGSSGGIQVTVKKTPSLGSGPIATPIDRDAFEMEVVHLVNEERTKGGLVPLEADPGLMQSAHERSEDMVTRGYFSHYDPATGEPPAQQWHARENISRFSTSWNNEHLAQNLIEGLMSSDGHRANIMSAESHRVGVGVAFGNGNIIITQLFAK